MLKAKLHYILLYVFAITSKSCSNLDGNVQELWTWTKLCSSAGGILWAISDALIGFHLFHHPIPHSQVTFHYISGKESIS